MSVVYGKVGDGHDSSSNFSDSSSWSEPMEISEDEIDFDVPAQVAMHPPSSTAAAPIVSKKVKSQPSVHPSHKRTVVGTFLRQTNQSHRNRSASPIKRPTRIITSSPPRSPGGTRGRRSIGGVSPTIPTNGPRMSVRVQNRPQSPFKKPKPKPKRVSPPRSSFSREDVTPIHFTTRIKVATLPKSSSMPEDMNKTVSNKVKYKTTTSPTKRTIVVIHPPAPRRYSGGPVAPARTPKIGSKKNKRSLSPKKKHVRSKSDDLPDLISPSKKATHRRNVSMPLDTLMADEMIEETDMVMDDLPKVVTTKSKPRSRSLDREPSAFSAISDITLSPDQFFQARKRSSTGGSKVVNKSSPTRPLPSRANKGSPTKLKKRTQSPKPAKKPIRKNSEDSTAIPKPVHTRARSMPTELLTPEEMVETVESDDDDDEEENPKQPVRIRSRSLDREPSAMTLFPTQFSQMPKRNSTGTNPAKSAQTRPGNKKARRKSPMGSNMQTSNQSKKPAGSKPTAERSRSTPPPTTQQRRGSGKSKKSQAFKERPKPSISYLAAVASPNPPLKPGSKELPKSTISKAPQAPRSPLAYKGVSATSDSQSGVRKNTSAPPSYINGALEGKESDAPIRRKSGATLRSKSPRKLSPKRTSPVAGERERSKSPGPHAHAVRRNTFLSPSSNGGLEGKESDHAPVGDIGQADTSPKRGRKSGTGLRSKSPRKSRTSPVAVDRRRSISPGPHAVAITMSGMEVEAGLEDGAYVYHERVLVKSRGEPTQHRYKVRTRQWSRRDRLVEFKQGSVCFGNKEIEIVTPPKGLVIIWAVIGLELSMDLIATAISFVSFLSDPVVCCEKEVQFDSVHLGFTIPFIVLVIAEIGFLLRAICMSLWPKSTYTLDGEVIITDEEVAADRGIGKTLCCIDWSPKSIFWTVSLLTIINPFFGFFITWILLYQSDKNEALAVMGIEAVSILLHFIAVHLEQSAPTLKLKCMHMLAIVAWLGTIVMTLLYLQQGGVCYNSEVNGFWLDGCEVCLDGSVPIDDNGLQCPYTTVIRGKNVTGYEPVFGLTLEHDTICEENLQMCWYTY